MPDFDDKDLAIIGIVVIFVTSLLIMPFIPHDTILQVIDRLGTVWGTLGGGLAGIATGKNGRKGE